MKKQVIVIHGGNTFETYEEYFKFLIALQIDFERFRNNKKDWKTTLGEKLGEDFEVILPNMPNKLNAKYPEWRIWFEKFIPYLESEIVLVGHSLGGAFLAKYLSENIFPKTIRAIFIVSAPYHDDSDSKSPLASFTLPKDLSRITQQCNNIFIYHSEDDPVVPFADFCKYQAELKNVTARVFKDRAHFNQENFPEILEDLKSLYAYE